MNPQKNYPNFEALKLNATDELPHPLSIDSSLINRSDEIVKTLASPEKRPSEVLSYLKKQAQSIQDMKSLINKQLQLLQVEEILLRNKLKQSPQKEVQHVSFNEETADGAKPSEPLRFNFKINYPSPQALDEAAQCPLPPENDKVSADDLDLLMLSLNSELNAELDKDDNDEDDESSTAAIVEMKRLIANHKSKTKP